MTDRHTKDRHKTPTMSVRPSAVQRAEIIRRAEAAGLSVNAFMLGAALAGSDVAPPRRRPRTIASPADIAALRDLLGQVGKLGNNVNQLARAVHLGERRDGSDVGPLLLAEVERLADMLAVALGQRPPA